MSCPRKIDVAAHVLGALEPSEARDFERHRGECSECRDESRNLEELPGLLHAAEVELEPEPPPAPPLRNLLPELEGRLRRDRRRVAMLASLGVVLAMVIGGLFGGLGAMAGGPEQARVSREAPALVGVFESVAASGAYWGDAVLTIRPEGTEIRLSCGYEPDPDADYSADGYKLVVTNWKDATEVAGHWGAKAGAEAHPVLFTRWPPGQIAALEVQTLDGYALMRWEA